MAMSWQQLCKAWELIYKVANDDRLGLDYIIAAIIHGAGAIDNARHIDLDDAERSIDTITSRRTSEHGETDTEA